MHTINFSTPVVVKEAVTTSAAKLVSVADYPNQKAVVATVGFGENVGIHNIIIWKGDGYDSIGQWTDADVIAALPAAVDNFIANGFKNEKVTDEQKQQLFQQFLKK